MRIYVNESNHFKQYIISIIQPANFLLFLLAYTVFLQALIILHFNIVYGWQLVRIMNYLRMWIWWF